MLRQFGGHRCGTASSNLEDAQGVARLIIVADANEVDTRRSRQYRLNHCPDVLLLALAWPVLSSGGTRPSAGEY
jgi:hypothetical protein